MAKRRVVIIGLDGVPYELIKEFSHTGLMPNMQDLISGSKFSRMSSSLPEVSSVAWSSIITGTNPAEHGIFGFTDFYPGSYKMRFPNFIDLKARPFWDTDGRESVIINVPSTYPVRPMKGAHISGFVSIDLERSVYPANLVSKLRDIDYRLDVNSEAAHKSMDLFLSDLDKTLEARVSAYRYFWEIFDWQIFMLVFTGTDRLMHFLWNAYEDKNHRHHEDFLGYFHKIDKVIGEIIDKMSKDDALIMLSDHGFEKLEQDVYLNYLLQKEGFLNFQEPDSPEFSKIDLSTKAFALDPSRIYLNFKGRYPAGGIGLSQKEKITEELTVLFGSLEIDGRKVINAVYRKEDIYSGSYMQDAPDLVLLANKGFNLKANIKSTKLTDKGIFTGKHSYENAFFCLKGDMSKGINLDDFNVTQVKNLINTALI